MSRFKFVLKGLSFCGAAGAAAFLGVGLVLAVGGGDTNGKDSNCCGYTGHDNPDGNAYAWSYLNGTHDLILSEWVEPSHDWVRSKHMWWTQTAETYLDNHTLSKALEYELRIHDQLYYNFRNNWQTNLPWSKAPENENWFEESIQKYTEVDMEQVAPSLIVQETHYFWDQQFDSEKSATSTEPDFYSELSWCNDSFTTCAWDETGWMEKVVKQK